jgi:hypothetical protein
MQRHAALRQRAVRAAIDAAADGAVAATPFDSAMPLPPLIRYYGAITPLLMPCWLRQRHAACYAAAAIAATLSMLPCHAATLYFRHCRRCFRHAMLCYCRRFRCLLPPPFSLRRLRHARHFRFSPRFADTPCLLTPPLPLRRHFAIAGATTPPRDIIDSAATPRYAMRRHYHFFAAPVMPPFLMPASAMPPLPMPCHTLMPLLRRHFSMYH